MPQLRPVYRNDDGKLVTQELGATQNPDPNEYIALITQTGTSAPTVTVLKNTLGAAIVWAYSAVGVYTGTLVGAFTASKTALSPIGYSGVAAADVTIGFGRTSADVVTIATSTGGALANALLTGSRVAIQVYP